MKNFTEWRSATMITESASEAESIQETFLNAVFGCDWPDKVQIRSPFRHFVSKLRTDGFCWAFGPVYEKGKAFHMMQRIGTTVHEALDPLGPIVMDCFPGMRGVLDNKYTIVSWTSGWGLAFGGGRKHLWTSAYDEPDERDMWTCDMYAFSPEAMHGITDGSIELESRV